tara:strand:+ start:914 stop:3151 length:2238 start_codon:yes stop_codon:yes gene_type:complete
MNYTVRNGIIIYIPKPYNEKDPKAIQKKIEEKYRSLKWRKKPLQNDCVEKKLNGKKRLTFHNSQLFLKDYFTPKNIQKGMIINHSVGAGKTCSAVAVGSNFDKRGYKILWVTQHKLKNDMWKNILGNFSCHEGYRHFQDNYDIPDNFDKQKRVFHKITKKRWYPPITYKQFSNALLKKNQLGLDLYKRNEEDPLKKILVIIDESHNLFNKSLPQHQKPNISIIRKNIYQSYRISKEDSVKLLFLTATPLLDNIMSYFSLINLIITKKRNKFHPDLKQFEEKYLKGNKFSQRGLKLFNDNTSRLVSVLDLSKNRNKFAQPTFFEKEILVNQVESEEIIKNEIKDLKENIKNLDDNIKKEINFDFRNQKELILYIKNDEEIEKKIKKLNKILEKEITKKDIELFKKEKTNKEEKEEIKKIKKNIKNTINNKKEIFKKEKKIKKEILKEKIKEKNEKIGNNSNQLDYQIKKCQNDNKKNIKKEIKCLQKKNLWNSDKELAKQYRFENKNFNKELLEKNIKKFSDKLDLLFQNIERIDKKTLEKTGKLYKHIIYVHNNGYQGMKLLISCMIAKNYNFLLKKQNNKLVLEQKNSSQNFLTLTSGNIYDKTFNKKITKEINELYNERPNNIHGEKCRFILIDYNYKEGIDLYDVKYFHILDSYLFETEMQQLVGRGTRNCGQKGLPFKKGWRLLTYLYYNRYDKKRSVEDIIKNLRGKNIGITEFDLKIRNVVKANIKKNAVDALLTKNLS